MNNEEWSEEMEEGGFEVDPEVARKCEEADRRNQKFFDEHINKFDPIFHHVISVACQEVKNAACNIVEDRMQCVVGHINFSEVLEFIFAVHLNMVAESRKVFTEEEGK